MARPIPSAPIPPPGICLLTSKLWQMSHGGASLRVQMLHGGASEWVQMASWWKNKTIIAHKLTYFYSNSSNHFLTAKIATFSRTVHVLLLVIPRSVAHVRVEPYATLKVWKTEFSLTMPHPRADLLWQMPHRGEGEVKKCQRGGGGGWIRFEFIEP